MIQESISGTGRGIVEGGTTDVQGSFTEEGKLIITGKSISNLSEWLDAQIVLLQTHYLGKVSQVVDKLHWTDVLALVVLSKTLGVDPYHPKSEFVYHAGNNNYLYLSKYNVANIITAIADSGGKKDWNSIITEKYPKPIDASQTDDPYSPWNKNGIYYKVKEKGISGYDPVNGFIIWGDGEIIWTKTGDRYFDASNGDVWSYDPNTQTVLFANGTTLNLVTLVRTTKKGDSSTVSNRVPWYKKAIDRLLTDRKLQAIIITILIALLIIKKRNE